MANKKANFATPVVGAGIGRGRRSQADGGQRSGTSTGDARRISELQGEVRELRRANEILKMYLAKELGLDPRLPLPPVGAEPTNNRDNAEVVATSCRTPPDAVPWTEAPAPEIPGAPPPLAEFRALGPIEAVVAGRPVDLGAPKQRALLALLVSRVGQPVAIDVIVEELWTGHPPPSAITSLQAYVANLRRVLEPNRAPRKPPTVLRTCGRGYRLDSRVVEVDAHRFGERATAGWQALDRGDPQQALSEFETGWRCGRGRPTRRWPMPRT